jgi:CheY-like chemotaxis protein
MQVIRGTIVDRSDAYRQKLAGKFTCLLGKNVCKLGNSIRLYFMAPWCSTGKRPDLILMDIRLPIMDGYTATNQIKADPALRSIPIIAVTSYALSGEEKKAREAGCDDYVPKPFSPRQLLSKIRQYLQ